MRVSLINDRLQSYISQAEEYRREGKYNHVLASLYRGLSLAELLGEQKFLNQLLLSIVQTNHDVGNSEAVIERCQSVLHGSTYIPEEYLFYAYLLTNLLAMGRFYEAEDVLVQLQSAQDERTRWVYHFYLSKMYLFLYKYLGKITLPQAEEHLNRAYQLSEELDQFQSEMSIAQGIFYLEEGLYYSAKEELLYALTLTDDPWLHTQIYNELGRAMFKLYEYEQAMSYLNRAKGMAEEYHYLLGMNYNTYYRGLYFKANLQPKKAREHLTAVLHEFNHFKRYPEMAQIYYHLYEMCEQESTIRAKLYLEEYRSQINHMDYNGEVPVLEEVYQMIGA